MISLSGAVTAVVYLIVAGLVFWLPSGYMPPAFPVDNLGDRAERQAKFVGECLLSDFAGAIAITNQANQVVVEPTMRMMLTPGHLSFVTRIFHVRTMCAKIKMCRVDTQRIVTTGAVVTDFHPIRDGSMGKFPAKTTCQNHRPWGTSIPASLTNRQRDMQLRTTAFSGTSPDPTRIGFSDLSPKSGDEGRRIVISHGSRSSRERGCGRSWRT